MNRCPAFALRNNQHRQDNNTQLSRHREEGVNIWVAHAICYIYP